MKTILVACSKGGVGKTTIATHLAAQSALSGLPTVLIDADPQGSSSRWVERREDTPGEVQLIDGSRRHKATWKSIPAETGRVIVDAPAGAMGEDLEVYLEHADSVLVPVMPSTLDIDAAVPFLNTLARHPRVRKGDLRVGLVANRLRPWTNASQQALELLRQWPYPLVGQLRDSQAYVVLVALGKSLFDYHSQQVLDHQEDWKPILRWVRR